MKRGHGFARQQAWDKAAAEYQRALAGFPDADALIAAGAVLINLKLLPEALAVLQHANQAKPNDLGTLEKLASVQAQLSYPADAAQTHVAIGNLQTQQGNTDQAVETWKRASNLDAFESRSASKAGRNLPGSKQPQNGSDRMDRGRSHLPQTRRLGQSGPAFAWRRSRSTRATPTRLD